MAERLCRRWVWREGNFGAVGAVQEDLKALDTTSGFAHLFKMLWHSNKSDQMAI